MIFSPSMSLLAAGVASGIFLYIGIRSRKNSKPREEETKRTVVDDGRCACCLAPFLVGRGVRCSVCGARSCRKACSRWDTSDSAWYCIFCHEKRTWLKRNEKWFENFGSAAYEEELHSYFGTAKLRVHVAGHVSAISDMAQVEENRKEKRVVHAVRNFVEKIVKGLVDDVDHVSIERLYKDSEYEKFLEEHRPPLVTALTRLTTCLEESLMNKPSTNPPVMAHAALREIVERAVDEARKLPELDASADAEHPREGRAIADNSYEDILATAILNKVIDRYQRERVDGNSNVVHDTRDLPRAKCATASELGLEEDASRGLECNGDDRASSMKQNGGDHREPVSFMMEEQIEEVTTFTSGDDDIRDNDVLEFGCARRVPFPEYGMDIVDPPRELSSPSPSSSSDSSDLNRNEYSPVKLKRYGSGRVMDMVSHIESWEDNWLFQKKRTTRSQPDAVAMLVPSSNAYYKALIGDRDAEDTSDLSECSSTKSDEEIEKELMEAINNVVPRSPRTSECEAESNQEMLRNVATQLGEDEIDACQAETKIENVAVCERFVEKNNKRILESSDVPEEKIVKDRDDKRKRSESPSVAEKGEDKAKEKAKDTTECGERTVAIAVESSAQKEVKTQREKSSERNDRAGSIADEDAEQRESEYTEHYDTAIQRHLDSLTKVEVCSGESETADETGKITNEQLKESTDNAIDEPKSERSEARIQLSYATIDKRHVELTTENDRLSAPPRPGTIAEREHKKWENAPPIENNPYSEESIRKRCLERQYSKSSDIPGAHYELTRLNEVDLEALLVPNRSDIKRFGRDYYINQSKMASGEQQEQDKTKSAMSSMSSRPSSSLSQRSSSGGDEQRERQEEPTSGETDDGTSAPQVEKETTALWRRNNAEVISPETNNRALTSRPSVDIGDHQKAKSERNASEETMWKDHERTDNILEDQRKNSKNEINAKLNNQEHNLEAERKDDKDRKVRRIDLKAYGFENEFTDQKAATRQQRVVNRLDLRSFGYQDGLRRARSNNQLDQPLQNKGKSNLTRSANERRVYKGYLIDARPKSFDCNNYAKSSRDLNRLQDGIEETNGRLISVKSMPNVTDDDVCFYANPARVNEARDQDEFAARNLLDRAIDKSQEGAMTDDASLPSDYDEISSDVDRSFENIYIRSKDQPRGEDEELRAMPSVKRLAEAFGQRQTADVETAVPAKLNKASVAKIDDAKDRSSTPEVQIIETPRQMHSLTARSLSREFREGLRQMPSKVTSPPVSRSLIEGRPANRTEIVRSKRESNDTTVISPGKLKSNIIFWEQMQKKS